MVSHNKEKFQSLIMEKMRDREPKRDREEESVTQEKRPRVVGKVPDGETRQGSSPAERGRDGIDAI